MSQETHPNTAAGAESLLERLRLATIGRYDVYAELGSGGMASVFLALDLALERKVAIKVMSPALTNSPDALERFKREAKVAAALSHPNIIPVYAVGDDPALAYFVMKYIEGRSLDSVIRESGAQTVPFVQMIIGYAGSALHYAHQRGVVHRDVKPANFMLDQDGWLVVTDFGIAKMEDGHGLTMSGTLIGTPYYMSPEQFNGQPITGASDQYALGIVAYELLTGRTPYHGATIAEVMRGHLLDEMPPIRSVNPKVPAELEACIARMLAKSAAERFPSLADAVAAFGAVPIGEEAEVRTQIISLAKSGMAHQPRMSVPLSPVPQARKARTGAQQTVARGSAAGSDPVPPAIGPRDPTPRIAGLAVRREDAPAPKSGTWKWMVPLLLLVAVGGTAFLRPDLARTVMQRLGLSAAPPVVASAPPVVIPPPQPDSAALAAAAAAAAPTPPPVAPVIDTTPATPPPAATKAPTKAPTKTPARTPARTPAKAAVVPDTPATKAAVIDTAPAKAAEPPPPVVRVETLMVATPAAPPPTQPTPEPVPTGPGSVRIGSRVPLGVLLVNGVVHGPIGGSRGLLTIEVPSGPVRLTIRADNCAEWDSTVTVVPQQLTTVGYRPTRCQ